jgi:hypothetical protein
MGRITLGVLIAGVLAAGNTAAMTGETVAPEFRGNWVPGNAACSSPVRLEIQANAVTFVNGSQRAAYQKLEQCFSCMGRDVSGIVWLTTDAMGDSPFTIYPDSTRKKAPSISTVEFSDKKLGQRFPFGKGPLKRCP